MLLFWEYLLQLAKMSLYCVLLSPRQRVQVCSTCIHGMGWTLAFGKTGLSYKHISHVCISSSIFPLKTWVHLSRWGIKEEMLYRRKQHFIYTIDWLLLYAKFQSLKGPWEALNEWLNAVAMIQILSPQLHCSPLLTTRAQDQSMMLRALLIMTGLASVQEPSLHRLQSRAPCYALSSSRMIALTRTCFWMFAATPHHSQRLNFSTILGIRNWWAEITPLQRVEF